MGMHAYCTVVLLLLHAACKLLLHAACKLLLRVSTCACLSTSTCALDVVVAKVPDAPLP
jgi:hypothetical protein